MLHAMDNCVCSRKKEAAIVVDEKGEIIKAGYKSLHDGYGHKLCRGECSSIWGKNEVADGDNVRCAADHAIKNVLIETFVRGIALSDKTIFIVSIEMLAEEPELIIPSDIGCCIDCRRMLIASGASIVLWNSTGKDIGCILYAAHEIENNVHLKFAPTVLRKEKRFNLEFMNDLLNKA